MERLVQAGKIEEVYFARLLPGEDILNAIYQICKEHDIKTGVILDGSGAGVDFTYQHFPFNKNFIDPRLNVVVATMEGKCEMSLQGTIGITVVKLPEGKSADELSDDPTYQAWVDAMCLTPIPKGESVVGFKTRCCEAFAETIRTVPDGSRVGFVVHGGVIMAIMEAYAFPRKDFYAYHIGNGECLQGVYDGETIQIK